MEQFNLATFRNAAPYIYAHQGHVFVITLPDEFTDNERFSEIVQDLALIHTLGIKLIIVYGPDIPKNKRGKHKVIDDQYLTKLQHIIGEQRAHIESLFSTGLINTPMAGMKMTVVSGNFVHAKPVGVVDGIDQQYYGAVRRINTPGISEQLYQGNIVLLPALGYSPSGECFYVDTHDVATTIAASLPADKLIFIMNENTLVDSRKHRVKFLTLKKAQDLLKRRKSLNSRVREYLELAINACLNRVERVHLLSINVEGVLLHELFSHDGAGTLVSAAQYDDIHPASIEHVGGIISLIKPLEEQGVLVPRTRDQIELDIHHYDVIERDGFVIGCAALYATPNEHVGEIACFAIHKDFQKEGHGSRLIKHLEQKAWSQGLSKLFVLTTQAIHWFREHGYQKSSLQDLPISKRNTYNYQRNARVYFKTAK